jgi:hypothetical protein
MDEIAIECRAFAASKIKDRATAESLASPNKYHRAV